MSPSSWLLVQPHIPFSKVQLPGEGQAPGNILTSSKAIECDFEPSPVMVSNMIENGRSVDVIVARPLFQVLPFKQML